MAEFLGVIGGIAASSEITKRLIELKRLCSTIRGVDQTLHSFLQEIGSINKILNDVEVLQNQLLPFVRQQTECEDSQKLCRTVASELNETILDLQRHLQTSRPLGSIRYLAKEGKIETLRTRLERAKGNVLLAQQTTQGVLQYQSLLWTVEMHTTVSKIHDLLQHPAATAMLPRALSAQENPSESCLSSENETKLRVQKYRRSTSYEVSYSTQIWIFRFGMQVHARMCKGNWTFNFRTYYTVPAEALISQLCATGDLDGIKKVMSTDNSLMSARIEPWGMTPLHVAISHGQVETARFLIRQGADLDECTLQPCHAEVGAPWSCFRIYSYFCDSEFRNKIWQAKRSDMLYLLAQENFCYDLSGDDAAQSVNQWLDWTVCIPEEEGIDIVKRSVYPPYQSTSLYQRLQWACVSAKIRPSKFWKVLGQETFDDACVAIALQHGHCNPLPRIIDAFGESVCIIGKGKDLRLGYRFSSNEEVWLRDLGRIIRGPGIQLLFRQRGNFEFGSGKTKGRTATYLQAFLGSLYPWSGCSPAALTRVFDLAVKYFAQLLLEVGLSSLELEKLGKHFRQHCVGKCVRWQFNHMWRSRVWLGDIYIRIVGFEYGPEPKDWTVAISLPFDETAGDFWKSIESPVSEATDISTYATPNLPGAWVDEDDLEDFRTEAARLSSSIRLSDAYLSKRRRWRYLRNHGLPRQDHDRIFQRDALRRAGWAERMTWRDNIEARKYFYGVQARPTGPL